MKEIQGERLMRLNAPKAGGSIDCIWRVGRTLLANREEFSLLEGFKDFKSFLSSPDPGNVLLPCMADRQLITFKINTTAGCDRAVLADRETQADGHTGSAFPAWTLGNDQIFCFIAGHGSGIIHKH